MENKLNREQLRKKERIESEVQITLNQMSDKFMNFLIHEDYTEEQLIEKKRLACNKWRVYCKAKNLVPKAYKIMDDLTSGMIEDVKNTIPIPEEDAVPNV